MDIGKAIRELTCEPIEWPQPKSVPENLPEPAGEKELVPTEK